MSGTGAVEERNVALGRVGVAVVEVHEEGRLAGVARQHLEGQGGEDTAAGGAVGLVRFVVDGLLGRVRGDREGLGAVVDGADEGGLGPGRGGRDGAGGDYAAVVTAVDGQVDEAYRRRR